jgi:RNA polymerase sigma-70 factor, ECF subfamily
MAALRDFLTRRNFERLTRELVTPLFRTARALVGNEADAEDLVQDSYVKAFVAFREDEFDGIEACRAWLFRIMINTFRDHYRRRLRRAEVELVVLGEAAEAANKTLATDAPGPDLLVEASFLRDAIEQAVQSLPPEVRITVILFFVEQMKYREIAEVAGCPIGTVMSRIARGRSLLQEVLAAGWRTDTTSAHSRVPQAGK